MRISRVVCWLSALTFVVGGVLEESRGAAAVVATVDLSRPGPTIPDDFSGLSVERSILLPDTLGGHYFGPASGPVIRLFRTLGIRSLRVGGNTTDSPEVAAPSEADLESLFAFAAAANAKVIYTLRLKKEDLPFEAREARLIQTRYASQLTAIALGNEPNFYFTRYSDYVPKWKELEMAVEAAAPGLPLCGPSVGPTEWLSSFGTETNMPRAVRFVSAHAYFCGAGERVIPDSVAKPAGVAPASDLSPLTRGEARDLMVSDAMPKAYETYYEGFVPELATKGVRYRLEEINNFYNGGAKGVSDTYAAALWSLELMYWWAEHGALGVNFHTGERVAAGPKLTDCYYGAFLSTSSGIVARPLAYGLLAFREGSLGRLIPVSLANPEALPLSAHATLGNNQRLALTVINRSYGASGRTANLVVAAPAGAEVMVLEARRSDLSTSSGLQLGGAGIDPDGTWHGTWRKLQPAADRNVHLQLLPATAVVVRYVPGN